ncbi:hypothetical protein NQZ68_012996 [Dissostichus eleginoides]|nr:hypothetical protein NQZ68_012996 [Dissostichus eleginoides]
MKKSDVETLGGAFMIIASHNQGRHDGFVKGRRRSEEEEEEEEEENGDGGVYSETYSDLNRKRTLQRRQ